MALELMRLKTTRINPFNPKNSYKTINQDASNVNRYFLAAAHSNTQMRNSGETFNMTIVLQNE